MFKCGAFSLNLQDLPDCDLTYLASEIAKVQLARKGPIELDTAEKCMVRCGQHIQAIKAYRARNAGMGLKDAKDACDAFRNTIPDYHAGMTVWSETDGRWVYPQRTNNW